MMKAFLHKQQLTTILQDLEALAYELGWSGYSYGGALSIDSVEQERVRLEEQCLLISRFHRLWFDGVPKWATKELFFPLQSSWMDSVEARIEFDRRWRLEWAKQKLSLQPSAHKELPALPDLLTSEDVPDLLQQLQSLQKRFANRVWVMFRWMNISHYGAKKSFVMQLVHNKKKEEKKAHETDVQREGWLERLQNIKERLAWLPKREETLLWADIPHGSFMMGAFSDQSQADTKEDSEDFELDFELVSEEEEDVYPEQGLSEEEDYVVPEHEKPRHRVYISKKFHMSKYVVTKKVDVL